MCTTSNSVNALQATESIDKYKNIHKMAQLLLIFLEITNSLGTSK
jgi:hypothetical protein